MNKVTLGITGREVMNQRFLRAWEFDQAQTPFIGFASADDLWQTLTLNRWQILKVMTGAGALTVPDVVERLGRDRLTVESDINKLLLCGLLDKAADDKIIFPYDTIHVDFMLQVA